MNSTPPPPCPGLAPVPDTSNMARSCWSVLVIVPAWNEEESIAQVLNGLQACAGRLAGQDVSLSVCVIDDGSTDGTAEAVRRAGADHVLTHRSNQGVGAAVRSGLGYARDHGFDLVVKLDADGQHDPADIPALIAPVLEDRADLVFGDRFPRMTYRMPWVRRWGNAFFRSLMQWLLSGWQVRDSQPGMFAASRTYLDRFFLPGDYNDPQQILLDAYLKGMRFTQVPVTFRARESGVSFISFKYPFKVLPQILLLLVMVRPLKVFLPLAGLFLAVALGVFGFELALWLLGSTSKPVEHANLVLGLALFGINTGYFGLLAELLVRYRS